MTLFTAVAEDYTVTIFRTLKAVAEYHANQYCFENNNYTDTPSNAASAADIARVLRNEGCARLYPLDGGDWLIKIERQPTIL